MKINGVTPSDLFPAHMLCRPDLIELDAADRRQELQLRAAVNHPKREYRADPADLPAALRSLDKLGIDPQGYPKGWTGPRAVGADWDPAAIWNTDTNTTAKTRRGSRRTR